MVGNSKEYSFDFSYPLTRVSRTNQETKIRRNTVLSSKNSGQLEGVQVVRKKSTTDVNLGFGRVSFTLILKSQPLDPENTCTDSSHMG